MTKKKISMLAWAVVILIIAVWALPQSLMAQGTENQEKARRLQLSFHVGATYPLNGGTFPKETPPDLAPSNHLNGLADSNVHIRLDWQYALNYSDNFKAYLILFLGFSQFTDDYMAGVHYYTFNISSNFKFLIPGSGGWYVQAGPGFYIPKPNLALPYPTSNTIGANIGFGYQIPISGSKKIEWGIDLHNTNFSKPAEPRFWFLTFQLGVIF
jgi:hypothetical protein